LKHLAAAASAISVVLPTALALAHFTVPEDRIARLLHHVRAHPTGMIVAVFEVMFYS